jgi:hypothetical protein
MPVTKSQYQAEERQLKYELPAAINLALQQLTPATVGSLESLIRRGGRIDPRVFNTILAEALQGGAAQAEDFGSELARLGLTGSVGGQAIRAAALQSAVQNAARMRAAEEANAIQRLTQALSLVPGFTTQPGLDLRTMFEQARQFNAQKKLAQQQLLLQAAGTGLAGAAQFQAARSGLAGDAEF